jgi:hypothetical protein
MLRLAIVFRVSRGGAGKTCGNSLDDFFMCTYNAHFLSSLHFLTQLKVRRDVHCLLNSQVRMQLIVLHYVSGELAEHAQVSFLSINRNRALDL